MLLLSVSFFFFLSHTYLTNKAHCFTEFKIRSLDHRCYYLLHPMTEPHSTISTEATTKFLIKMDFIIKTRDSMMHIEERCISLQFIYRKTCLYAWLYLQYLLGIPYSQKIFIGTFKLVIAKRLYSHSQFSLWQFSNNSSFCVQTSCCYRSSHIQ